MIDDPSSDFCFDDLQELSGKAPAKKKKPAFDEQLDHLSADGKFEEIFEHLLPDQRGHHDPVKIFRYLRRALQVASVEDLQTISTRFLHHVLVFNTLLTLRLQLGVTKHFGAIREFDPDPKYFADDRTDETLGYWRDMVLLNCELIRTIAATERQWALAKKARRSAQDIVWNGTGLPKLTHNGSRKNGNGKHHGGESDN